MFENDLSGAWVSVSRGSTFTESRKELLSRSSEAMDSMIALFRSVYLAANGFLF